MARFGRFCSSDFARSCERLEAKLLIWSRLTMAPRFHSLKIPFFTGTRGCGRRAAVYELFCFCIGVLFGLCATGGINLQFPEQILCPYGGVWRFVVSHPSAIRLRKDGAPSVCRWVRGGAPGSGQVTRSPPNDPETRVPVGCGLFGMYGPPPFCKRKMRMTELVCANVFGLYWSSELLA